MFKRRFMGILTFVVCVLTWVAPSHAATRTALVIGNGDYDSAPLKNPANDAVDMAKALRELGFEVIEKTNASKREMILAVDEFAKRLRNAEIGVFYFAGHGMQIHGRNYLIPVKAHVTSETDVQFEAMDAGRVLGKMQDAGNKLNIVILDACRDNPFKRSFRTETVGLAQMDAPKGSIIAYATAPGSVAADGHGRNGLYTKHLLKSLAASGLTVQDVFMETGMGVMKETGDKQIPWISSTPVPRYYLASRGTSPGTVKADKIALPSEGGASFDDILKARTEQKQAMERWSDWQSAREKEYAQAQEIDNSNYLEPEQKAAAWGRYLAAVSDNNPFSNRDEELRKKAEERIRYWKGYKVASIPKKIKMEELTDWPGIKLTYSNFFPPAHIQSKLSEAWCKEVEKRTNGKVKVEYYPGGTLTKAVQCYDGVVTGQSDIGFSVLAYTRGRFPVMSAVDLPLGYASGKAATEVVNAVYEKFKPKELQDTEVMYLHAHGPGLIHTKGNVVKTLEDMKGLKLRCYGTSAKVVKALGGIPVATPMSETYQVIQNGVADGAVLPFEADKGWRIGEVVDFVTLSYPSAYTNSFFVVMNKDKWNSLPTTVKEIIKEINKEWAEKHGRAWDEADEEGKSYFISKGGKVVNLGSGEARRWKQAVAPIIEERAQELNGKGFNGNEIISYAMNVLDR